MRKIRQPPNPYLHLNINRPTVVPTVRSKFFRGGGRYESGETLPHLDRVLDRTLKSIAHSHDSRGRSARSFDALWEKVCKTLKRKKNAAGYDHWKRTAVIKNAKEFEALDHELAEAWAQIDAPGDASAPDRELRVQHFEQVKQKKEALAAKSSVETDDMLEVAIAYWIEAKNARDDCDELRALHALIECWMHIGMTLSPKTESESKSDAGAKQGKPSRDEIANLAAKVIASMDVDGRMADPVFLLGTAVEQIKLNHPAALAAYDKQATNGRKAQSSVEDRLTEKLMKWATDKSRPYPDLADAYRRALHQAKHQAAPTTRNRHPSRP